MQTISRLDAPRFLSGNWTSSMSEQLIADRSDDEQLRKYRELAEMLAAWRDEPDESDWNLIEAEINNGGMTCREPEHAQKSGKYAPVA